MRGVLGDRHFYRDHWICGPIYTSSVILEFLATPIKPNPPKDGDGKPRVLASSDKSWKTPPKDSSVAGLPPIRLEKKHAIFDVFDWFPVLGCL